MKGTRMVCAPAFLLPWSNTAFCDFDIPTNPIGPIKPIPQAMANHEPRLAEKVDENPHTPSRCPTTSLVFVAHGIATNLFSAHFMPFMSHKIRCVYFMCVKKPFPATPRKRPTMRAGPRSAGPSSTDAGNGFKTAFTRIWTVFFETTFSQSSPRTPPNATSTPAIAPPRCSMKFSPGG